MGERAKLRYNGVSYYDRDLKIISDKACKELTCVFHSYKLDRKTGFLIVYAYSLFQIMVVQNFLCRKCINYNY